MLHGKLEQSGFTKNRFKQVIAGCVLETALISHSRIFAAAVSAGCSDWEKRSLRGLLALSLSSFAQGNFFIAVLFLGDLSCDAGNFYGRNAEPFGMQDFKKHFIAVEGNFMFMG